MRDGTAVARASGWSGAAAAIEPMRATSTGTARKEARLTAPQGSSRAYRKVGRAQLPRPAHPDVWLDRFCGLERRRGSEVALADEEERHDHADEGDRRAGPERVLEPVGERIGTGVPDATASLVVDVAIVERIAIPTAPPICCDVLIRPDARPASCCARPGERRDRERDEGERHPEAR